jgi:hypothetical protein
MVLAVARDIPAVLVGAWFAEIADRLHAEPGDLCLTAPRLTC